MESWKIILIVAAILVLLGYLLYYFGIGFTSRAYFAVFRADCSLPARWEGKFQDTTGCMRRNFVVFKKYHSLVIETETYSGMLEVEIKGPDGSILSPSSGVYGREASFLFDVSRLKRCSATLRMDHFSGQFRIALQ